MFRRLKKNLVLFNMGLLTLVFAAIFSAVAGLMVATSHSQTDMMLRRALDPQHGPFRDPAPMGAILLVLDDNGEILSVSAPLKLTRLLFKRPLPWRSPRSGKRANSLIKPTGLRSPCKAGTIRADLLFSTSLDS